MSSTLYNKHNYLNKEINYLINMPIKEYDMVSGGFSILKKADVFTDKELSLLERMEKFDRNVYIGKMLREERELSDILMEGFTESRRLFFEANDIQDDDVLSIKKDAIFLSGFTPRVLKFNGIEFQQKSTYTSYYYINNKEFYFRSRNNILDVKGIGDDILKDHEDYFLEDLKKIFRLAEKGNMDTVIRHIKKYRENYLKKQLPIQTYRELNMENIYRTEMVNSLGVVGLTTINEDCAINIGYNYVKYLIPLIKFYL